MMNKTSAAIVAQDMRGMVSFSHIEIDLITASLPASELIAIVGASDTCAKQRYSWTTLACY
jgi:hypothetical protein